GKAPQIQTIDRLQANSRRAESLKGVPTIKSLDRDESPMAMFKEGGKNASVKHINPSDNRGFGSWVGNQLSDQPDNTKVKWEFEGDDDDDDLNPGSGSGGSGGNGNISNSSSAASTQSDGFMDEYGRGFERRADGSYIQVSGPGAFSPNPIPVIIPQGQQLSPTFELPSPINWSEIFTRALPAR
ncbi:MAG: NucA/NucB deoxyribonuclease domain-containing protein, partial [Candidatus Methanomethyliaceae archaeon]|nr:NucA/NucB deoxyribonuclease domain-containing protein [Candidatus Methanomethyliaceae archaeon]